jgi:hypothetical protein
VNEGDCLGIELVRFVFPHHAGPSPVAIDSYRNQLAKFLRKEHTVRQIPPVHVSVHFSQEQLLLSASGRSDLAEKLFAFVAANIPPEGLHVSYDFDDLPSELYALGVSSINIIRNAKLTKPFWGFPNASFVPESTAEQVQALIDKKSSNLANYRKQADRNWLLIISGTQGLQSILDLDAGLLDTDYVTGFDRLFLFRAFGGTVHELKRRDNPSAAVLGAT